MTADVLSLNEWQIRFHEAMADLLRAKEAVKRQIGLIGLVNRLWKTNRDLKSLSRVLKELTEAPDGVVNEESFRSVIPQLRQVVNSIDDLLDSAHDKGLLNRSFTAGAFESVRLSGEELAERLDTLEISFDPDVRDALTLANEQYHRGEYISLGSLSE